MLSTSCNTIFPNFFDVAYSISSYNKIDIYFIFSIIMCFLASILTIIALQFPYLIIKPVFCDQNIADSTFPPFGFASGLLPYPRGNQDLSWYISKKWNVYPSPTSGVCVSPNDRCYYYNDKFTWIEADRENDLNCLYSIESKFRSNTNNMIPQVYNLLVANAVLSWLATAIGLLSYVTVISKPVLDGPGALTRRRETLFVLSLLGCLYCLTVLGLGVPVLAMLGLSTFATASMWTVIFPACSEVTVTSGAVFWASYIQIVLSVFGLAAFLRSAAFLYRADQQWRAQLTVRRVEDHQPNPSPFLNALSLSQLEDSDYSPVVPDDSGDVELPSRWTLFKIVDRIEFVTTGIGRLLWKYKLTFLAACVLVVSIVLMTISFDTSYYGRIYFDATFNYPPKDIHGQRIHRIAFIGDSLCPQDDDVKDVMDVMTQERPHEVWVPIRACHYGGTIRSIRQNLVPNVLRYRPEAIILYWDSDASDVDEGPKRGLENNTPPSAELQSHFVENLRAVLETCLRVTERVAVMGPTIWGERPRGTNGRDVRYEVFMHLVGNITAEMNITYIHTRDIFFSHLPPGWDQHTGYLTFDGEHPNRAGMAIVVDLYKKILHNWFT